MWLSLVLGNNCVHFMNLVAEKRILFEILVSIFTDACLMIQALPLDCWEWFDFRQQSLCVEETRH